MSEPNSCKQCGRKFTHRPVGVATTHFFGGDTHGFCSEGCMRAYEKKSGGSGGGGTSAGTEVIIILIGLIIAVPLLKDFFSWAGTVSNNITSALSPVADCIGFTAARYLVGVIGILVLIPCLFLSKIFPSRGGRGCFGRLLYWSLRLFLLCLAAIWITNAFVDDEKVLKGLWGIDDNAAVKSQPVPIPGQMATGDQTSSKGSYNEN